MINWRQKPGKYDIGNQNWIAANIFSLPLKKYIIITGSSNGMNVAELIFSKYNVINHLRKVTCSQ